jgi:hypothetical protein
MLDAIRTFIRKDIAAEVPDDLSACMDCDSVECPEEEFKNCPNRLARLTELQRLKNANPAHG